MNTASCDALAQIIHSRICEESLDDHLEYRGRCIRAAEAILDAGYRKPLRVNTHDELARMPDGTVIRDWNGGVGEKRDWPLDLAVRYVDRTTEANADIELPATVLYVPEEGQ